MGFLVKFREGAELFILSTPESDKSHFQFAYFVGAVMLLNQILGVVQLNWMISERLFRFVFAGEDGIMSSHQLVKKDTWQALVAKTLFTSYGCCIDRFTMLLTFNDRDFQRLEPFLPLRGVLDPPPYPSPLDIPPLSELKI